MEKIAMWGGIAGIVIAIFAIVIIYLTRANIIDLLDRDVVMYDKNYELKKSAIEEAFNCLDVVAGGQEVKSNPQFIQRAKAAYNGLLCTLNNPKLYQDFYAMAIDRTVGGYSTEDFEKFKISCRAELIAKRKKKNEGFKGVADASIAQVRPMNQRQTPPARPTQPARQTQRPTNTNEN